MVLLWKIRYLDRTDKLFKDRSLYLDTKSLDPTTRALVELAVENKSQSGNREILRYRNLFVEGSQGIELANSAGRGKAFVIPEYFEDELGKNITQDEIAQIVTGSSTARMVSRGAKPHDVALMWAEPKAISVADVSLSPEEIRLLGYFVRDLNELIDSAFMKDSPCTLTSCGGFISDPTSNPTLETAATDDEIRSFVTIFRRLYMTSNNDPANFLRIVPIATKALGDHAYSKWIEHSALEYQGHLAAVPDARPFVAPGTCTFSTKRLIDVFLYTQYAHQPDGKRQRQFGECLAEVGGKLAILTGMFLTEMWKCSLEITNVGRVIARWFRHYCECHHISPDVLKSLRHQHLGLGAAEKDEERRKRLIEEKAEQLSVELWEHAGRPLTGPSQYLKAAREQILRGLQI